MQRKRIARLALCGAAAVIGAVAGAAYSNARWYAGFYAGAVTALCATEGSFDEKRVYHIGEGAHCEKIKGMKAPWKPWFVTDPSETAHAD